METKFTKGILFYNKQINKVEKGSDEYKIICSLKHRYIQDFN